MIDRILSKISMKAQQGEYFNNPLSEGKIFKISDIRENTFPEESSGSWSVYGDPTTVANQKREAKK